MYTSGGPSSEFEWPSIGVTGIPVCVVIEQNLHCFLAIPVYYWYPKGKVTPLQARCGPEDG